jgi:CheY-like chemotaxis protein
VDDQPLIILGLERMLRRMRGAWEVVVADSGRKAQEKMKAEAFNVLLTDLNMPGLGGVGLLAGTGFLERVPAWLDLLHSLEG